MALSNNGGQDATINGGWDLRCLSTDPNPTNTENYPDGVSLFEKDTFKVFFFDKPNNRWIRKNGEVRS